jgi:ribosome-associated heat shock protein Hsp15
MAAGRSSPDADFDQPDDDARQRLDKFLVYARFVKTRAVASELIRRGRVRLNGQRMLKPDRQVGAGDVLTLNLPHGIEVVRLLDLPDKRGSAKLATALYERLTGSEAT